MLKDALVALCFDDMRKLGYTNKMSSIEFVSLLRQEYGFSDVEAFSLAFCLRGPMLWSDDLIRVELDTIRFFDKATQEELLEHVLRQLAIYIVPEKYKIEKKTAWVPPKVFLHLEGGPYSTIDIHDTQPYRTEPIRLGVSFDEPTSSST